MGCCSSIIITQLQMLSASFGFSRAVCRSFGTTAQLMKGHSKWDNIRHIKGAKDMQKSQATNQLLRKVRSAVSRGGFDPKMNSELAGIQEDFKKQGLSMDTFKNFLIKMKEKPDKTFYFEIIGPNGTFFIVEAEGPQKHTVESSLRKYFNKLGGGFRVAADGAGVRSWFEEKGVISLNTQTTDKKEIELEQMEEAAIELDCEEVQLVDADGANKYELLCEPNKLNKIEGELVKLNYAVESASIEFRPMHPVKISDEDQKKIDKLYEFLQEDDFVQQIFDNIEPED